MSTSQNTELTFYTSVCDTRLVLVSGFGWCRCQQAFVICSLKKCTEYRIEATTKSMVGKNQRKLDAFLNLILNQSEDLLCEWIVIIIKATETKNILVSR